MPHLPYLWLVLAAAGVLLVLGVAESLAHRRSLARIPIRVHVNGTRGKSSVTRLIAAGLRAGGVRTAAKTSGTVARLILPDGQEYPVFRPSRPNVIEQVRIVAAAAAARCDALVVECMALQPRLQALSELQLVRATHGVITNARPDHLDVMGPTPEDVALALAGSIPAGGVLFTGEERHLPVLKAAARDRGTRVVQVGKDDVGEILDEEMARFDYLEHKANVALALRVCEELGVDRWTALCGMWAARPDPGVMTVHEIDFFGRRLYFVNGFAANDEESTEHIWRVALDLVPEVDQRIAVFNCRADRADRSKRLGDACASWPPADAYVLTGSGTHVFARAAHRSGVDLGRLVVAEGRGPAEVFETLVEMAGPSALIMGMGNAHGGGLDLARYFRNRAVPREI